MAETVESLSIKIGLDPGQVISNLDKISNGMNRVASSAAQSLAPVSDLGKTTVHSFNGVSLGARKATASISTFGRSVRRMMGMVRMAFYPVMTLLGGSKMWAAYSQGAEAMDELSAKAKMNISDLDAWSKANEAAGGSAKAFTDALSKYIEKTKKSGEDFIRLGSQIRGMTDEQARDFMKLHGLSKESIAIFKQSETAVSEYLTLYRKTAFTAKDAENVRKFRQAWNTVKVSFSAVGIELTRVVVPVLTKLGEMVASVSKFMVKHIEAIKIGLAILALFMLKTFAPALARIATAAAPILLVAAALALLAIGIQDLMVFTRGGKSLFEQLLKDEGKTPEEIEQLRQQFKDLGKAINEAWENMKPLVKMIGGVLLDACMTVLTVVVRLAGMIAWVINDLVNNDGKELKKAISDWWNSFVEKFETALAESWTSLKAWAKDLYDQFYKVFVQPVVKAICDIWSGDTLDKVLDWVIGIKDSFIAEYIDPITSALKKLFSWETIKDSVKSMWDALVNSMPDVIKKLFNWKKYQGGEAADPDGMAPPPVVKNAETVVAKAGAKGTAVDQDVKMEVHNNITLAPDSDANAVASAVGGTVTKAGKQTADMVAAGSSGVTTLSTGDAF